MAIAMSKSELEIIPQKETSDWRLQADPPMTGFTGKHCLVSKLQ